MKPAAGYLRRSTTKQEQSLDGQQEAIQTFAKAEGFTILRWYTDDGISGSTGDERPEFQRMIEDARGKQDFQAVIAYDVSRFGRMDGDETGYYRHLLRQTGVRILFSNETAANATDEVSEIIRPVLQAQKRKYLRQISRDTLRGQLQSARAGWASGRAAAFGFDRMLVDANGTQQKRLKRGEKWAKDRSWHISLVPSDTPGEVETLKWIFQTYAENEIGVREIARSLNEKGIKSPHDAEWGVGTVRAILRNPVYKGDIVFGRRAMGQFHRVVNGQVKDNVSEQRCVDQPEDSWIVSRRPEIALISQDVWDRVNEKMRARKNRSKAARARKATYALAGLIRCANCGRTMVGTKHCGVQKYYCSSYYKAKLCACNTVYQDNLLSVLRDIIRNQVFQSENWSLLASKIAVKNERDAAKISSDEERIARQLRKAKEHHSQAAKNLLLADSENVPALNQAMTEFRLQIKSLERQLDLVRQGPGNTNAESEIANAHKLFDDLMNAGGERLKEVLSTLVERIDLQFGDGYWGCRKIRMVTGCDVYLNVPASFTTGNRGDSRWTMPNEAYWWLSARVIIP